MSALRDTATERQLLASVLLEPSVLESCGVSPSELADPACALTLSAMLAVRAKGEPVDTVSVGTELQRRGWDAARAWDFLLPLTSTVPPSWRTVAERLRVMAEARRIAEASALGQAHASRLELDEARGVLAPVALGSGTRESEGMSGRALMEAALEAWIEISQSHEREQRGDPPRYIGLKMGSAREKVRVAGGECCTVAAATGVGKSSLALTEAVDLERRGIASGIVCVEDSFALWGAKLIGYRGKVDTAAMWRAEGSRDDWGRAERAVVEQIAGPDLIRVERAETGTVDEVISKMAKCVRVHGARVLFVDYLQAISAPIGKGITRRDMTDLVLARIQSAARALDVPLVLFSQLSRPEKGDPFREPYLSDMKESGTIENSSDAVVMMWILTDDKQDESYGVVLAKVAKTRIDERGQRWAMVRTSGQVLREIDGWTPPRSGL